MMSLLNQLFDQGDFELILEKIFCFLDGPSLESCSLVCKKWRQFILMIFQRKVSFWNILILIFLRFGGNASDFSFGQI